MLKKKSLFITFEGIEGSGKSYQAKKLLKKIKKMKLPVVYTREPGGSRSAESIRSLILNGNKDKFTNLTDTLLYLAARNEHVEKKIKKAINDKKIIICDRFIDSTYAYQIDNKKVTKKLIDYLHKIILDKIKPDITFVLKLNLKKSFQRLKKRKKLNRYDKLSKKFYTNAQNIFLKKARANTKRFKVFDTSKDTKDTEREIYKKFIELI
jgi:dTMP kinase